MVKLENHDGSPAREWTKLYCDAIFEGGGVKGFAFLGALQCFADHGIFFRKIAGASAGASLHVQPSTVSMRAVQMSVNCERVTVDDKAELCLQGVRSIRVRSWPCHDVSMASLAQRCMHVWYCKHLSCTGLQNLFAPVTQYLLHRLHHSCCTRDKPHDFGSK